MAIKEPMTQISRLKDALYLATFGWHVFPLHHPILGGCSCGKKNDSCPTGKHPMSMGWQKEATVDPKEITKIWKKHPEANIGLATGKISNLIVLDVDGKEGEEVVAEKGHEPTVISITGRGRQLFFAYPGEKVKNKVGLWPKLDSRGDNGYVVAPGSLHKTGKLYAFDPSFTPDKIKVAKAPEWWLRGTLESSTWKPQSQESEKLGETKQVRKGSRNSTLASMAGVLRDKGLSVDAIKYSLMDYNKTHCDPPLFEDEVTQIAQSYGRYLAGDPSKKLKVSELVNSLKADRHFITSPIDSGGCGVKLMLYADGVYKPNGAEVARRMADKSLGNASRPETINSIVDLIRERTKTHEEQLNPMANEWINTSSGMLDWRTGELHPHSHEHLSTFQIQASYDAAASHEMLDKFIEQVFPPDAVPLVEEIVGYLMVPSTKYQKAIMLIGEGANGKSTFLHLLSYFLHECNISRLSLQQLEDSPFAVAELQGKLANIYADIPNTKLEKSDTFKSIVAGDQVKAERKFGHPFILKTVARLIFSANEFPRSSDSSQAYFRRWIIVPFPNKFEGKLADHDLLKKLLQPSVMSALLNRALLGLRRLEEQGHFSETKSATAQVENYRVENNSSYAFAREVLKVAEPKDVIAKADLYEKYAQWCSTNGVKYPETTRKFNKTMESSMRVVEVQHGPRRTKSWSGVAYQDAQASKPGESKY